MTLSMQSLKYFRAVFANEATTMDPVDCGHYPLWATTISNLGVDAGDVMLLYCAATYPTYYMSAPAIGVVLRVESGFPSLPPRPPGVSPSAIATIYYSYLPLDEQIPLEVIRARLKGQSGLRSFNGVMLSHRPLLPLTCMEFRLILVNRYIVWPCPELG